MTTKSVTLTATMEFPFVETFNEYIDLELKAERLTEFFGRKILFHDIVYYDMKYWGILYVGTYPSRSVAVALLKKAGYNPGSAAEQRAKFK